VINANTVAVVTQRLSAVITRLGVNRSPWRRQIYEMEGLLENLETET